MKVISYQSSQSWFVSFSVFSYLNFEYIPNYYILKFIYFNDEPESPLKRAPSSSLKETNEGNCLRSSKNQKKTFLVLINISFKINFPIKIC